LWGGICAVLDRLRGSCDDNFCGVFLSCIPTVAVLAGIRLCGNLETGMKRRILLVDDELAILLTLKTILGMNGFEVETAASAREAEQKLDSATFDMVITDMCMERQGSGFEVIRVARRQSYNPATAILTAYPDLGADWRSEGAESLLVKPMNTNDLLRQIEALLVTHQDSKTTVPTLAEMVKPGPRRVAAAKSSLPKAG
jgi:DNA-binding response OmpR family regulator